MTTIRERRISTRGQIRADNGAKPRIEGYAAVFDSLSEDLGGFRERIMPGAFSACLNKAPDVRCLFNHDANIILGRTRSGTLVLREDARGLHFECTLADTQPVRDVTTLIKRGDVDQCSFGFYVQKENWKDVKDSTGKVTPVRELFAVDVFDVSPVTFPAYPDTTVATRSLFPKEIPKSVIEHVPALRALLSDAEYRDWAVRKMEQVRASL